jgi:HEAT repeat protein
MQKSSAIEEAKKLLAENQLEKARDHLLEGGFIKQLDRQVEEAFLELIPVNEDLNEWLNGPIRQLQARDPKVRRDAARQIRIQAMKEFSLRRKAWMADPRTTGPLIQALRDPNDPVVEEVAGALAMIIKRYFPDLRAFDPLASLLASKRKGTRHYAVLGVGWLDREDRWDLLVPFLTDKAFEVRRAAARVVVFKALKATISPKTRAAMREALQKSPDKDGIHGDLTRNAIATLG